MTQAPPFSARPFGGGEPVSLADLLRQGPVALAFFKISCPTCQLAFPYLERLHAGASTGLQFIGISQNNRKETGQFVQRFGLTFPVLLDPAAERYPASNAYGLTHVPTIFVVETDGAISHSWAGFSKADFEKLALRAGAVAFGAGENVPAWKAG